MGIFLKKSEKTLKNLKITINWDVVTSGSGGGGGRRSLKITINRDGLTGLSYH